MKTAVTGYKGKLGSELIKLGCAPLECDVTDIASVKDAIFAVRPGVIIHCAAETDVDGCESKEGEKKAFKINVRGTSNVREAFSGRVIHLSTSYIFDGKHGPYAENTRGIPTPANAYGFTKLAAEALFRNEKPGVTVRTVGLYGGERPDYAKSMIDRLSMGEPVYGLTNYSFNPTYAPHLAVALMELSEMKQPPEVVNVVGSDVLNPFDFALAVARVFDFDEKLVFPTQKVHGWIASRPSKAGLRIDLARKIGLTLHDVNDGLLALKEAMYARA